MALFQRYYVLINIHETKIIEKGIYADSSCFEPQTDPPSPLKFCKFEAWGAYCEYFLEKLR